MAETTVKRLKRSALLHYIDTSFNTDSTSYAWFLIGKDVSELSVNLNLTITPTKNILDETNVTDEGYEPNFDVDTYYADPSDGAFYEKIKDIAMNRLTGDDCKTRVLEVTIDKTSAPYDAWIEDVIIKPQTYGGATGGVRYPYHIAFCGGRRKVSVTITDKIPTITAASGE